jgi:hypothetical protein
MRRLCAASSALILAAPALAQDRSQTLADIRQELSVLFVELQRLGQELNTTGGASGTGQRLHAATHGRAGGGDPAPASLTEELQIRVDSVVRDGTNRVGDLEFRLCELEADCDIGSLGETPNLGGVEPSGAAPAISVTHRQRDGPAACRCRAGRFRPRPRGVRGGRLRRPRRRRPWPSRRPIPAAPERAGAFPAR